MARTTYTETDKANVFVVLTANGGNLKRTAREFGIPVSTIRRWQDGWEKNGPPDTDVLEEAAKDFLDEAEEVRGLALTSIRDKIAKGDGNVSQLATVLGILDDKIARARGLATSRVENVYTLPAPEQVRELMAGFVSGAIEAAKQRQEEIVDAEIVEQAPKALSSGRN